MAGIHISGAEYVSSITTVRVSKEVTYIKF
jgi:hypothetical protein